MGKQLALGIHVHSHGIDYALSSKTEYAGTFMWGELDEEAVEVANNLFGFKVEEGESFDIVVVTIPEE